MNKLYTQHQGFTLIELMVTLSVLAIVLGIGLPSFRNSIANASVTAETNRVVANINFSRSQAVAKGQVVTLAKIGNIAQNWSQGWNVFSDFNSDSSNGSGYSPFNATDDIVLKTFSSDNSQITIRTNAPATSFISFNPSGRLIANGGAIQIAVCDSDLTSAITGRLIDINNVGRTSVSTIAAANKTANCSP